jgi:hypothetical protein
MRNLMAAVFICALGVAQTVAAAPVDQELHGTVERFVAAQNAHDLNAVTGMLLDSPNFLWITRGTPVWGRSDALSSSRSSTSAHGTLNPSGRRSASLLQNRT